MRHSQDGSNSAKMGQTPGFFHSFINYSDPWPVRRGSRAYTSTLANPSTDDHGGQTWFGVWWRQQQLPKLGVFNIFNPAEVQEPQRWQWGRAQGRDGEPGAPRKHQLLQA